MTTESTTNAESTGVDAATEVWNLPNILSMARIVLAVVCFVAITCGWYLAGMALFLLAAATDWLDGYLARKWNQITQLGRILDPFADKVIVCGAFILLAAEKGSLIAPWMAVVVTGRELLVTALRSLCEGRSMDFSARWAGKWKMVFQCVAIALSLWRLSYGSLSVPPPWLDSLLVLSVWISIIATIYSGWGYVQLAAEMLRTGGTDE